MGMNFLRQNIAGCVSLAVLGLAGCGKPDQPGAVAANAANAAPRTVRVARAESRPMDRVLHVVGTLSAAEETTVAAQVAGQIEKYRVDLGDQVRAGQELALIDTTAYEALARQSAANVTKAQASAANAAQNLKRVLELQRDKIASTSELDQAVAESDQAQAEVKAVEAAEAIARLNLERSRVKAPFDGAVAERIAHLGSYAAVGTPIVRLVKTDPLRLRLEVPEREALAVRVGQDVRLNVEGDPNLYSGKLARVAPALRESNRMLSVEADVPAQGALRPGLFARAQIIVTAGEPAVSLPPNAIVTFAGLEKVVTIKDGKALEKAVVTGRRGPDWVEVVSGLAAGEVVVLDPAGLRTGQPVTGAAAPPAPTAAR
jgi:RND family efflux transporter MFP subunit